MNNIEIMWDQQVTETHSQSPDTTQQTVCEDCGRVWIVECNNEDINLCLDNEHFVEVQNPAFHLIILREETDPLVEVTLNSPVRLTCIVMGPKEKCVYKWKVNHKGRGSAAYSGCKIVPVLHCDDLKMKYLQTSSFSDDSITKFKPLNRKRKNIGICENDRRGNMRTKIGDIINENGKENSRKKNGLMTDSILNDGNIKSGIEMYNSIKNNFEKADDTKEIQINHNVDCTLKCETEEVHIKEECLKEEPQDFNDITDQCTDLLDTSSFLLESQEEKLQTTKMAIFPVETPGTATGVWTTQQSISMPLMLPHHQTTMQLPNGSNSQVISQFTQYMNMLRSITYNQQNLQGFKAKPMQKLDLEVTPKPKPFIDLVATKCFCGLPGLWYNCALECQRCKRWIHEKCTTSLQFKLICGDRLYLYVCKFCNNGREFLARIAITWDYIVHLAIWNLSRSINKNKDGNFFEYDEQITTWVNNYWELLQCPADLQSIPIRDRSKHILLALKKNKNKFKCGNEQRKRVSLWSLRVVEPPPVQEFILPPESPLTLAVMHKMKIKYCKRTTELTPIPKGFRIDDFAKTQVRKPDFMDLDNDGDKETPVQISGSKTEGRTIHQIRSMVFPSHYSSSFTHTSSSSLQGMKTQLSPHVKFTL